MKKIYYFIILLFMLFIISSTTVYASDKTGNDIYDNMKEKNTEKFNKQQEELLGNDDEGGAKGLDEFSRTIWNEYFKLQKLLLDIFPITLFGSIVLGTIIMIASRKNKALFKFGLYSFVIAIPVIMIILVFGLPGLHKVF